MGGFWQGGWAGRALSCCGARPGQGGLQPHLLVIPNFTSPSSLPLHLLRAGQPHRDRPSQGTRGIFQRQDWTEALQVTPGQSFISERSPETAPCCPENSAGPFLPSCSLKLCFVQPFTGAPVQNWQLPPQVLFVPAEQVPARTQAWVMAYLCITLLYQLC